MKHRPTHTTHSMIDFKVTALAALMAVVALWPAAASAAEPVKDSGHAGHHGASAPAAQPKAESVPLAPAKPAAVNHGEMRMQGGGAPAGARDPHADSGGYTLDSGPFTLGGPRQLRLGDEHSFAVFRVQRLEGVRTNGSDSGAFEVGARFGRDYDRLVIKAEGELDDGKVEESKVELLWSHAVATFWDAQFGLRRDAGAGPQRSWLAVGLQGLAPYWFEVDMTAYVGDGGRFALRLGAEYELLLTQQWIVQPRIEANLYSKSDPARELGRGLADLTAGLRVRYEFTRQFAPYLGVEWAGRFGETADLARAAGEPTRETRWVAGLSFWF